MAKTKEQWRQIVEMTAALEIARAERDACRERLAEMRAQLSDANARADRAEDRLAQTTRMLFDLGRDAVATRPMSTATEVMVEGRSVLRLSRPIGIDEDRRLNWPHG